MRYGLWDIKCDTCGMLPKSSHRSSWKQCVAEKRVNFQDPLLFYSVFLPAASVPSHHRYQTQIVVQSLLPSCVLISSPSTGDYPSKALAFLSFIVCVLALHCCMWAFFSCGEQGRCSGLSTLTTRIIARFLIEIPWVIFPTRMLADSLLHFREN